jgi:methylmalonyl-CoA mutase N-terminal domain/subunit
MLKIASSGIDEKQMAGMKMSVAGDYIVVSADTCVQGLELMDINGRVLKNAGGNCLNVADVAAGVYLVRVHINGRTTTRKVALGR